MAPPRKFDWDAARQEYADGDSITTIAERHGVSWTAVQRVVVPGRAEAMAEANKRFAETHRVPCIIEGCENMVTHTGARYYGGRCRDCGNDAKATTVRETELLCIVCREWKPDDDFPHNRSEGIRRRGRHGTCRSCLTAARREYRNRHKVPCAGGCGRLVLAPNEQAANARYRGTKATGCCTSCAMKIVAARARAAREELAKKYPRVNPRPRTPA